MAKEKQETKIKRIAQLLFDNAEMIVEELSKTPNYRALNIQLNMFKSLNVTAEVNLTFTIYDGTTSHYHLEDDAICLPECQQLFVQLNKEAGLIPLPKPVKVREKLEEDHGKDKEQNQKEIS